MIEFNAIEILWLIIVMGGIVYVINGMKQGRILEKRCNLTPELQECVEGMRTQLWKLIGLSTIVLLTYFVFKFFV